MARPKSFDPDTVLDAAVRTFWTHGYAGTTPQRLVDELGIGRGSLYDTFGGKHEIFLAALDRYRSSTSAAVTAALREEGRGFDRLRRALELVAVAVAGRPDGCLLTTSAVELGPHDAAVAAAVRATLDDQREGFEAAVRAGARDGSLRDDLDPSAVATWLLATTNGLQALARTGVDRAVLSPVLDTTLTALLPRA
ncbi:MAG: TetR/AcrR family transcriptional regulator [Aeromicrobium erythreum]